MFETILSGFMDEYPNLLRNKKTQITAVTCIIMFLLGVPCITEGGVYVLQIMDWYCASFSIMLLSFMECSILAWVYGSDRLFKDIELMIGYPPHRFWHLMWRYVTPIAIACIWFFSLSTLAPVTYGGYYEYPGWALAYGWFLGLISMVTIPITAIVMVYKTPGPIICRIKFLLKPDPSWGPAQPEDRKRYLETLNIAELEAITTDESSQPTAPPRGNGVYDDTTVAFLPKSES